MKNKKRDKGIFIEQSLFRKLEQLEAMSSRTGKVKIIKSYKDPDTLREVFDIALNPYRIFGIHDIKIPCPLPFRKVVDNAIVMKVIKMAKKFEQTSGRNIKIALLNDLLRNCSAMQQKWVVRILTKQLRCGVSDKTINSIFTDNPIPIFTVQLADVFMQSRHRILVNNGEFYIEPKLDGLRLIITQYPVSRKGLPLWNVQHFVEQTREFIPHEFYIDGELLGEDWNESVSIARSKVQARDHTKLNYYIFDIVPRDSFEQGKVNPLTYVERRQLLEKFFQKKPQEFSSIHLLPAIPIRNFKEMELAYKEFVQEGFEGAILKKKSGKYEYKRSSNWLKIKPTHTYDCEIVSVNEGEGRLRNTCGSITVLKDNVPTNVGGMTDEMRQYLWDNRHEVIGSMAEIGYQSLTKDKKMLFPRFLSLREDL